MRLLWTITLLALFPASAVAFENGHFALQAAHSNSGNSLGFVRYGDTYSGGIYGNYTSDNAAAQTSVGALGLFFGPRSNVAETTYISYGIDLIAVLGTLQGVNIDHDWIAAPYIGVEQNIGSRVVVTGWINPYSYEHKSLGGLTIVTHSTGVGGIGIAYLF